jgi:hypothetical protein
LEICKLHFHYDPLDWETVSTPNSIGQRRRDPAEATRLKAERERAREDAVLAEAEAIKRRRGC